MAALDLHAAGTEPELLPFALNRLMAAWNARLAERLAPHGVSFAQWRVLMVCSRATAAPTIIDLSERTLVPHSTLSRQVAAMERAGLLKRVPAEQDARAVEIVLTARGRARYREVLPVALAETEAGLAELGADEREQLRRILQRVEAALAAP
jgi:DNA-binding MarR family transcriptional regulator